MPQAVRSICILRLSALGDVVHVVAVIRCIQQALPDCALTWVIGKVEAGLVGDLPGVEFIVFDKKAGWHAYQQLRQQMRGRNFDVLLHMQVALRASLASVCIPAKRRLGFDYARARNGQWLFTRERIAAIPQQHVLAGLLEFAKSLGVEPVEPLSWDIPLAEADQAQVKSWLEPNKAVLVINPCSSNSQRNWPLARYQELAEYAIEQYQMQVVLSGGMTTLEQTVAAELCASCAYPLTNLVGKTSLKQLLALLQQATLLLAPDTGPVHMATAVGTPVIGLYAASNPLRTGPYYSQEHTVNAYPAALQHYLGKTVAQVRWGRRVNHPEAMQLISVAAVREKLDQLMGTLS